MLFLIKVLFYLIHEFFLYLTKKLLILLFKNYELQLHVWSQIKNKKGSQTNP